MTIAGRDIDAGAVFVAHGFDGEFHIAVGVDQFDAVADGKFVLHFDFGHAVGVVAQHIADIQAAVGF